MAKCSLLKSRCETIISTTANIVGLRFLLAKVKGGKKAHLPNASLENRELLFSEIKRSTAQIKRMPRLRVSITHTPTSTGTYTRTVTRGAFVLRPVCEGFT